MLIHNPDSSYTFNFNGWIIHGHHANDLEKYLLINPNEAVDVDKIDDKKRLRKLSDGS